MYYSHWEKKETIKNSLEKVNYKKNIDHSGLPVIYDGDEVYITRGLAHTLVIGSTGSGKTQAITLPTIKLSLLAGESLVINDMKGELFKQTASEFKKRDYNVVVLDFDNAIYGNYYNPLGLAHRLYKEENRDRSITLIEEVGYYLFSDTNNNLDPFWTNSTIDYFTGLCLYLFEKSGNEVNLNDAFDLANRLNDNKEIDNFLKEIGKGNAIYYNVSGTLTAPSDTRGGIISTFNQKLKKYVTKEKLSQMMSKTDFDISTIAKEKTVVYIVSGCNDYSNNLVPMFIHQVFEAINIYGNDGRKTNILLDEFDELLPIRDFSQVINYSRSVNINFTVAINSYINLLNTYGKDNIEIIKLCFANIVYLYANDIYTLDEICKLCGNQSDNKPLVTPEELKINKNFEAIFLMPRMMPFKNTLTPDYKIDWDIRFEESNFELRK